MSLLRSLFSPCHPIRTFALLDSQGICRAFKQSSQATQGSDWIEVCEQRLNWLDKPLPTHARIAPVVTYSKLRKPLAA